jgi:hypothetical protein
VKILSKRLDIKRILLILLIISCFLIIPVIYERIRTKIEDISISVIRENDFITINNNRYFDIEKLSQLNINKQKAKQEIKVINKDIIRINGTNLIQINGRNFLIANKIVTKDGKNYLHEDDFLKLASQLSLSKKGFNIENLKLFKITSNSKENKNVVVVSENELEKIPLLLTFIFDSNTTSATIELIDGQSK